MSMKEPYRSCMSCRLVRKNVRAFNVSMLSKHYPAQWRLCSATRRRSARSRNKLMSGSAWNWAADAQDLIRRSGTKSSTKLRNKFSGSNSDRTTTWRGSFSKRARLRLRMHQATPNEKIGISKDDPRLVTPSKWHGENILGKALVRVRGRLRRDSNT